MYGRVLRLLASIFPLSVLRVEAELTEYNVFAVLYLHKFSTEY